MNFQPPKIFIFSEYISFDFLMFLLLTVAEASFLWQFILTLRMKRNSMLYEMV